jgi:hypothetical protein
MCPLAKQQIRFDLLSSFPSIGKVSRLYPATKRFEYGHDEYNDGLCEHLKLPIAIRAPTRMPGLEACWVIGLAMLGVSTRKSSIG